jgi:hypothetical protein
MFHIYRYVLSSSRILNLFKGYVIRYRHYNMPKYIDNLIEDPVIPNQAWCCLSFLSPETLKNCTIRSVKVRGVYATREEANERAKFLQQIDPDFNIFVAEVGKWLAWDPDPSTIEDQVYREKQLQEIMTNYKKNNEKAKILEEERKRELLEESIRNQAAKDKGSKSKKDKEVPTVTRTGSAGKINQRGKEKNR